MIQVLEKWDPALQQEVRGYLAGASPSGGGRGVSGDHDPRWLDVLREGLGHRPFMLIARGAKQNPPAEPGAEGRIAGYLPLALVASRLFGRFLVSLPYLNMAGVVADDVATANELIERAVALAAEHKVQYLELRHGDACEHASLGAKRDEKVRMVLELPDPAAPVPPAKGKAVEEAIPGTGQAGAELLWRTIDSKARNLIRKGEKSELSLRWHSVAKWSEQLYEANHEKALSDFYGVFATNMRDLGTPVYSRSLFANILQRFPSDAEIAVVYAKTQAGEKPIAGALLVHDPIHATGGTTQVPSASALREFNSTNANMWMYHRLLLRTVERGSRRFDFGRSSVDSGTYKFKKQWGAQPHPTVWQYHVRFGDINAVRPDSPKNRRRIETWQKLPVWLTRLIGPTIVRGIP